MSLSREYEMEGNDAHSTMEDGAQPRWMVTLTRGWILDDEAQSSLENDAHPTVAMPNQVCQITA
jgi:hypothetical protein